MKRICSPSWSLHARRNRDDARRSKWAGETMRMRTGVLVYTARLTAVPVGDAKDMHHVLTLADKQMLAEAQRMN